MKPISGRENFSYDDVMSAISFIDNAGLNNNDNIPNFDSVKLAENSDVKSDIIALLEGCAISSRQMIANGTLLAGAIKPSTGIALAFGPGNETKFDGMYWWGCDLYLNNAFANVIANALWIGAGAAAIAAAIGSAFGPAGLPVALTMAIAAGLLGIGAAVFGLANASGRGVYLRCSYIPPFLWLGSQ